MHITRWLPAWLLLAAGGGVWGDDSARKGAPEDPDSSFLEFLGSVDGLADTNPDYLAQTSPHAPPPGAQQRSAAASAAPAVPAAPPPGAPPRESQVKNNE